MKALITGITGQDGSYLAELLLEKGYEVHGLVRRSSSAGQLDRIKHILSRLVLHEGDMLDAASIARAVLHSHPNEVYNLAAQSHVGTSFTTASHTVDVIATGTARLLEAVKQHAQKSVRYYQASTSEMYGSSPPPQNETTVFHPRSPYGCAKLAAHWLTVNAREQGMHTSSGILFNHESPRRGETFVTRKITLGLSKIARGSREKIRLGNLDASRDWGHARDYVRGMWLMLQQETPSDFVLATGEMRTVREFLRVAFTQVGRDYREHVEIDPAFYRPTEVHALRGDNTRARDILSWSPETSFETLVREMVDTDLLAAQGRVL